MIITGTGHRPNKLGGYDNAMRLELVKFARRSLVAVLQVRAREDLRAIESIISGMALGWDQALASAAVELGIPFVAAVPCEGQDRLWPKLARQRYDQLLKQAAQVVTVTAGAYHPGKMQRRNEWMVDRCTDVLALWNGSDGGTANCVAYAERIGRTVVNVWPVWDEERPRRG